MGGQEGCRGLTWVPTRDTKCRQLLVVWISRPCRAEAAVTKGVGTAGPGPLLGTRTGEWNGGESWPQLGTARLAM